MSRTTNGSPDGLYAINVFWLGKGLTSYQPYVSGLFNDVTQVNISLIDGYKYRFDCTFLESDELPHHIYDEDGDIKYGRPFALTKEGSAYAPVTNRLIVSLAPFDTNTQFHQGIYFGNTEIEEGTTLSHPSNHRYYDSNTIDLTTVTQSNVVVNLELKRAYCNLMFESKDIPQGDKIRISLEGTTPFIIAGTGGETVRFSEDRLLALSKTADHWSGNITTSETAPIKVEYYFSKTEEWRFIYQDTPNITLKRNKRNIVRFINIDQATGKGNITVGEGATAGDPIESEIQDII